ncbi:hypothetical protein JXD20_02705 [Candidatus Peregrinibacteria bacterium]|nr:hypothetical protein [Candidatus Peregrinibacteria bacterium]
MAQFEPFAPNVEVNGETVLATVNSFPEYMKDMAIKLLKDSGISNPKPGNWYSQKAWLDSFREIYEQYGSNTLYEIGKRIPANAKFPPKIHNIEEALAAIDVAYHNNHRNGKIGFYRLVKHDKANKRLIMHCKNPYPCDFDRGIITAMARKFEFSVEVELDTTKPSRKEGAEDSWYIVSY